MPKLFAVAVLPWIVLGCILTGISPGFTCEWSGFGGCECNILGACDASGKAKSDLDVNTLTGYAPSGIQQFGYRKNVRSPPNLAYLCEGNTVAILYDCNARIPLYAATKMTGKQLSPKTKYARPPKKFKVSTKLHPEYQQNDRDYENSKKRNICYESRLFNAVSYFVQPDWYSAVRPSERVGLFQPCDPPYNKRAPVHKGHLIASLYGKGNDDRTKATFTYTNVVPQFGAFNSGAWSLAEVKLVKWGQDNCVMHKGNHTQNATMYIVVGAIPSTVFVFDPDMFFGESGFSNYQGRSTLDNTYDTGSGGTKYRVNVPRFLWTAACCTFQFQDEDGQWKEGVQWKAFYRENEPSNKKISPSNFFTGKEMPGWLHSVRVFPRNLNCSL